MDKDSVFATGARQSTSLFLTAKVDLLMVTVFYGFSAAITSTSTNAISDVSPPPAILTYDLKRSFIFKMPLNYAVFCGNRDIVFMHFDSLRWPVPSVSYSPW